MSDGGGLQKKFKQKAAKEAKTSKWARASLLSKKSSKKGLTRRPLFLVRVESLVCTVEIIGPSRSAGAGRDALQDALPRVRRCTSRDFFLLLLRTRSCAIEAEALSHQPNEVFVFLGRTMSDRAGARPYQLPRHRLIKSSNPGPLRSELIRLSKKSDSRTIDKAFGRLDNAANSGHRWQVSAY